MRKWEIQFQKGRCSWQSYMSVLVQKLHLRGWRRRRSKVFPERDERRIHVGTSIPGVSTHPSYVPWAVRIFEMIRCFSDKFGYWYYHVMVVRVNLVWVVGLWGCWVVVMIAAIVVLLVVKARHAKAEERARAAPDQRFGLSWALQRIEIIWDIRHQASGIEIACNIARCWHSLQLHAWCGSFTGKDWSRGQQRRQQGALVILWFLVRTKTHRQL